MNQRDIKARWILTHTEVPSWSDEEPKVSERNPGLLDDPNPLLPIIGIDESTVCAIRFFAHIEDTTRHLYGLLEVNRELEFK